MLINNIHILNKEKNPSQIETSGKYISRINSYPNYKSNSKREISIDFSNTIAFPGLINSHDHLEFNLFPKLSNKIYNDYVEWGIDIHIRDKEQIEKIKAIPYEFRFKWGLYKNLICGVTTVAHHGSGQILRFQDLPDIISSYNYLHSVRLEKNWKLQVNLILNRRPFVIHIGEGTNRESSDEIIELLQWNFLNKKFIGVHGISLNRNQAEKLSALVWCPDSNLFLYGKTADITLLKNQTNILFGTDSALSADWNIWNHLRLARRFNYLNDEELFNSLSVNAVKVWNLQNKGSIETNNIADMVIAKMKFENEWESFYNINPEDILLILKNGEIVFIDAGLANSQKLIEEKDFDIVCINSINKLIVKGIRELITSIRTYVPEYEFPISIK